MNYWVFKCDRKKYRLDDSLNDPAQPITWRVTDYRDEIKPGDVAFISQTRNDRGMRTVVKTESYPAAIPEIPSELKYWVRNPIDEYRAKGVLARRGKVISFKTLKTIPKLADLSIYSQKRATNFKLTQAEGKTIMGLIL